MYLTQVFQQVEGVPLYRYQLRLRLARALELLPRYDDLTSLSLDLGFYSHSHFSHRVCEGVRLLAIDVQAGLVAPLKSGKARTKDLGSSLFRRALLPTRSNVNVFSGGRYDSSALAIQ